MSEGWGQIPSDIKAEGKRDPGQPASPLTCLLTNTPQRRALERLRRATGGRWELDRNQFQLEVITGHVPPLQQGQSGSRLCQGSSSD